jgi:hypothetical protein
MLKTDPLFMPIQRRSQASGDRSKAERNALDSVFNVLYGDFALPSKSGSEFGLSCAFHKGKSSFSWWLELFLVERTFMKERRARR